LERGLVVAKPRRETARARAARTSEPSAIRHAVIRFNVSERGARVIKTANIKPERLYSE